MNDQQRDERIVQLIGGCQRSLFVYLTGLLCSRDLADDVLQETNLIIWRKREQYRIGTNFFAWACRIAYFEACKAREKRGRKVPAFSEMFLDKVAPELAAVAETSGFLQTALSDCVDELKPGDRDLIERRYDDDATVRSIAAAVGRSADGIYKSLKRVHRVLFDCISAKMRSK